MRARIPLAATADKLSMAEVKPEARGVPIGDSWKYGYVGDKATRQA
jgi:hypothetical protein